MLHVIYVVLQADGIEPSTRDRLQSPLPQLPDLMSIYQTRQRAPSRTTQLEIPDLQHSRYCADAKTVPVWCLRSG